MDPSAPPQTRRLHGRFAGARHGGGGLCAAHAQRGKGVRRPQGLGEIPQGTGHGARGRPPGERRGGGKSHQKWMISLAFTRKNCGFSACHVSSPEGNMAQHAQPVGA